MHGIALPDFIARKFGCAGAVNGIEQYIPLGMLIEFRQHKGNILMIGIDQQQQIIIL